VNPKLCMNQPRSDTPTHEKKAQMSIFVLKHARRVGGTITQHLFLEIDRQCHQRSCIPFFSSPHHSFSHLPFPPREEKKNLACVSEKENTTLIFKTTFVVTVSKISIAYSVASLTLLLHFHLSHLPKLTCKTNASEKKN
jgi:hypothetical protein